MHLAYWFILNASFDFRISPIFCLSFELMLKLNLYMGTKTIEGVVTTFQKLTFVLF